MLGLLSVAKAVRLGRLWIYTTMEGEALKIIGKCAGRIGVAIGDGRVKD
jgi:hypothetical protein